MQVRLISLFINIVLLLYKYSLIKYLFILTKKERKMRKKTNKTNNNFIINYFFPFLLFSFFVLYSNYYILKLFIIGLAILKTKNIFRSLFHDDE